MGYKPTYDRFGNENGYSDGLKLIKSGSSYGFINEDGEIAITPKFVYSTPFHQRTAIVCNEFMSHEFGIINTKGEYLMAPKLTADVYPEFHDGLALFKSGKKYLFINTRGENTFDQEFDDASNFCWGCAWVRIRREEFIIDTQGNRLNDCCGMSYIQGRVKAMQDGKYGFRNLAGQWVVQPVFDNVQAYDNISKTALVLKDGKCGLLDASGRLCVPCIYDKIDRFDGRLAAIWLDGKCGFVKANGDVIVTPQFHDYQSPDSWSGQPLKVKIFGQWFELTEDGELLFLPEFGLINTQGEFLIEPRYTIIYSPYDGFAPVQDGVKWGIADIHGNEIVEPKYDIIGYLKNGFADAILDKVPGKVSAEGVFIPVEDEQEYVNDLGFDDCSCLFECQEIFDLDPNNPEDFVEIDYDLDLSTPRDSRDWYEPEDYPSYKHVGNSVFYEKSESHKRSPVFEEADMVFQAGGFASVKKNGKWGLIDGDFNIVIPTVWDAIHDVVGDGLVPVCRDGLWGYINLKNEVVIPLQFHQALGFKDGYARVSIRKNKEPLDLIKKPE